MRWGLLGFKLHICHQDRFLLLYYSTSVTLRATCNNKGDNSLLTKPWIKVPKRSRTEYNRGKPASIIEQALLMPHLYAIYTHGNNDAKITKDIIHSRAYRMKGGVLTYKPFPFVAQKTDFWLNHFIFPRNWLTLQEFLATVDFERWKSNFTKWQIFCPPSFFAIKLVIHVLRYFFGGLLFLYYFSCRLLEIVFHSWHVGGAVLLKVNLHAWRKSSFLGTCQKNLSSFPLRFLNFIKSEMLGIFECFYTKLFLPMQFKQVSGIHANSNGTCTNTNCFF